MEEFDVMFHEFFPSPVPYDAVPSPMQEPVSERASDKERKRKRERVRDR
jgi:hypothetical protein